eukprot:675598-Rhodomonas_salina.1
MAGVTDVNGFDCFAQLMCEELTETEVHVLCGWRVGHHKMRWAHSFEPPLSSLESAGKKGHSWFRKQTTPGLGCYEAKRDLFGITGKIGLSFRARKGERGKLL